jgi:hypothetical protein
MQTPTQYPTWAVTAAGEAVFIPDQFSFTQAVKSVAQGGIGATWGTATPSATRSLGGGATLTTAQPSMSGEQTDGRPPLASGHGGSTKGP